MAGPVSALNRFVLADNDESLARARRSPKAVAAHGGRVIGLVRLCGTPLGDIEPRKVMILVEWASRGAFESDRKDPTLAELHAHREDGTRHCIWHRFEMLEDLRPLLK